MTKKLYLSGIFFCLLAAFSCADRKSVNKSSVSDTADSVPTTEYPDDSVRLITETEDSNQFNELRGKIVYGVATLADVRLALAEKDVATLTNTVHALYSMRWHRGVFKLLYEMWKRDKSKYPELNWDEISKAPVRIALASTLNRIQISDTKEFQRYMRSFQNHEHEFIRAQVVVGLGFNGDPTDIAYLTSMAEGDNDYVAQSAITSLGLMNNTQARDVLIEIVGTYRGTERGAVINGILKDAYNKIPVEDAEALQRESTSFYD